MARWGSYDSRGQEPRVRESAMKPVGKPDARNGHVRFDERGRETGRRSASVPAPVLDSTCKLFHIDSEMPVFCAVGRQYWLLRTGSAQPE